MNTQDTIKSNTNCLTQFLNLILQSKEFINCQELLGFLKLKEDNQFDLVREVD